MILLLLLLLLLYYYYYYYIKHKLNKVHQKVIVIKNIFFMQNLISFCSSSFDFGLKSDLDILLRDGWFCTWLCSEGGLKRVEELQGWPSVWAWLCTWVSGRRAAQLSRAGHLRAAWSSEKDQTSARTGAWTYGPRSALIGWDHTGYRSKPGAGHHRPPFQLSCSAGDRLHL